MAAAAISTAAAAAAAAVDAAADDALTQAEAAVIAASSTAEAAAVEAIAEGTLISDLSVMSYAIKLCRQSIAGIKEGSAPKNYCKTNDFMLHVAKFVNLITLYPIINQDELIVDQ